MPGLSAAAWLAIAAIASSAAATGTTLYESSQQSSAEQQAQKSAQQAQAQQALVQKQEALTAAGPNAQSQTSGSLTGPANQSFVDILAGYPGSTGGAPGQPTGATNAANPANTAVAGNPISQALAALTAPQSPNFTGGWQDRPLPQFQPFSLASEVYA